MGYRYDIAIRSTHKYALRASGDVARVADRPDGGVALLVVDGQGSGPAARAVARDVASRLGHLLEAGTLAEIAAIAANQALTSDRLGQVSASFDVVIANPDGSLDLARFSTNAVYTFAGGQWTQLDTSSVPAGRSTSNQPALHRFTASDAQCMVIATDGAGDLRSLLDSLMECESKAGSASNLATSAFESVMSRASHRPKDDVTVAVLRRTTIPAEQRFETFDYSRDVR